MGKIYLSLVIAMGLLGCGFLTPAPKGDLIYCSYACRGAAGLGSDYCELIADPDSTPKIVVVLNEGNRFDDPVIRRTYPVEKDVVDSLSGLLAAHKVYKLNGYHLEEPITGGHSYRIYQEYSSGDKINAFWYGHGVKNEAIAAYNLIAHFFSPWYKRAEQEGRLQVLLDRVSAMEQRYDRLSKAVRTRKSYPELREDMDELSRYQGSGQWKDDFEADEKGMLPKDLKRGVLSEDGLDNLLRSEKLYRLLTR